MNTLKTPTSLSLIKILGLLLLATAVAFIATTPVQSEKPPATTHDGLVLDEDQNDVAIFYVKPDADFSVYKRFKMLDAYVAFKKNWERNTKVAGRRIPKKDVERIKREAGELLHETFQKELDDRGGYTFVDEADDDVLILRPALIDLEITAPDIKYAGRIEQYVASAGAATLYLELYDSVSGEILARILDRRRMQDYGYARWSNSVTNRADATRMFRRWAELLRKGLDEQRADAGLPPVQGAKAE
jgi:hypothetical protein